jgi:hypothetical protein
MKFHENPSCGTSVAGYGQTDGNDVACSSSSLVHIDV